MIHETIASTGELKVVLKDKNGIIKQEFLAPNLVVSTGRNFIAASMTATGRPTDMSHMSVGTGSTAAALANTQLTAEIASSKVVLTTGEGVPSTNTIVYTATFPAGSGTGALVEAGIFNAAGDNTGTMLCRTVFSVVNKGADDSVTITWTVTIA